MSNILLLLFSSLSFSNPSKADTIDYWHVYYNNTQIKDYNRNSKGEIIVKVKDIRKNDSLTIVYFRDIPCKDCETEVFVESESHFLITKGQGLGTFTPIKISVFELLIKADRNFSYVYYQERDMANTTQRLLLFKIKLE